MIKFIVDATNTSQHLFSIWLTIKNENENQEFMLPNWINGSYKIRDFSRHITNISCKNGTISQIKKNRFRVNTKDKEIVLNYQIYAFDLSVRESYLDENRGFFNGSSVFLLPIGFTESTYQVSIITPQNWKIATTLQKIDKNIFSSNNYNDLIDNPVEMSDFDSIDFLVNNIPHNITITGKYNTNKIALIKHLTLICEHHQKLFNTFPVDRYLFLTLVTNDNYGGLEHKKSTSLICSYKELENNIISKEYTRFLALCSHEYFHTWWIKDLKPKSFKKLDLENENYTEQLWIFEGITSYYDELSLIRTNILTDKQYLNLFSITINRVLQAVGNFKQSIASASFNAWINLYQTNENSNNVFANYYTKGSLVAFLLDIKIRKLSNNKQSLDEIVQYTYNSKRKSGLGDDDFKLIIEKITNHNFDEFFVDFVYGIKKLPLQEAFDFLGISIVKKPNKLHLGCELNNNNITHITNNGCAETYGLCVKDEIVSINNTKVTDIEKQITSFDEGEKIEIGIFRDKQFIKKKIILTNKVVNLVELKLKNNIDYQTKINQKLWFYNNS